MKELVTTYLKSLTAGIDTSNYGDEEDPGWVIGDDSGIGGPHDYKRKESEWKHQFIAKNGNAYTCYVTKKWKECVCGNIRDVSTTHSAACNEYP